MTEAEARAICQREGVTPHIKRRHLREYLYIADRVAGRLSERYVCPMNSLPDLTEATLVERIEQLHARAGDNSRA